MFINLSQPLLHYSAIDTPDRRVRTCDPASLSAFVISRRFYAGNRVFIDMCIVFVQGRTALHVACESAENRIPVIRFLLSRGANPGKCVCMYVCVCVHVRLTADADSVYVACALFSHSWRVWPLRSTLCCPEHSPRPCRECTGVCVCMCVCVCACVWHLESLSG